jgi:hypothetical protein
VLTRIDVTQEHIDRGVSKDCLRCPVALAIMCHVQPTTSISVGDDAITMLPLGGWFHDQQAPSVVRQFVRGFDRGDDVVPFSFDLDIPEGY